MAAFSDEDRALFRKSLRDFLNQHSGEAAMRALAESETGADPDLWRKLAGDLGVGGLLVPEALGGLGLGAEEMQVLLEESAGVLYGGPVLSTAVLAPTALLASGDAAASGRFLPRLAAGALIAAVALEDEGAGVRAGRGESGFVLNGAKTAVIDGGIAELILVVARDSEGVLGLFALPAEAEGVARSPLDVFDRTRRQSRIVFENAAAERIGGDFAHGLEQLMDIGAIAAAAEQVGVAQRALDLAVDYAKVREQFGKPIGSFQAVKHLCAEMLVRVECLRAAVTSAAKASGTEAASEAASVAKSYGSLAATFVAENLIQVLGGIGYTWEHPAHLYLRRAKTLQFAFGDAPFHRARIARLRGLGAAVSTR